MTELWLILNRENDETGRIPVDRKKFVIGRHSGADLSINNSSISRQHAKIERFGDIFVISDMDSTYGTSLNGIELTEPAALKDGDTIDLGGDGGVKLEVELIAEEPAAAGEEDSAAAATDATASSAAPAAGGSSIPRSFFFLAPIFGLVMLLCVGGGLFYTLSGDSDGPDRAGTDNTTNLEDIDEEDDPPTTPKTETATPKPGSTQTVNPPGGTNPPTTPGGGPIETPPPPKSSSDMDKVRAYSASFLSRITAQDKNAFLLDRQIQVLMPTVNKFKSSAALADNLKNANKNSAQIAAIAR